MNIAAAAASNMALVRHLPGSARTVHRYRSHSMLRPGQFVDNMLLAKRHTPAGDVVECGVWRGGVIRGLADMLGRERTYHLFDSFQGLPPAEEIDGPAAVAWQASVSGPTYFDNCSTEELHSRTLFEASGYDFVIHSGWFDDTIPMFKTDRPIALLRLDADWYSSTMTCLVHLLPQLAPGALVIVDDYYTWDGCSRAVHDYLSREGSALRIRQSSWGTCYMINNA